MARKKARQLVWEYQTVYRWEGNIRVHVTDPNEEDRSTYVELSEEQAIRLASRLALQLGYKMVEAE